MKYVELSKLAVSSSGIQCIVRDIALPRLLLCGIYERDGILIREQGWPTGK